MQPLPISLPLLQCFILPLRIKRPQYALLQGAVQVCQTENLVEIDLKTMRPVILGRFYSYSIATIRKL